jgi:hypothetical protein
MDTGTVIGTAIGVCTGLAIPGTIAVFRLFPQAGKPQHANGNGNGAAAMQDTLRRVIDDRLGSVLARQTEILEQMRQTLGDNTMALQLFMKLEEQRERLKGQHGND